MKIYKTNEEKVYDSKDEYVIVLEKKEAYDLMYNLRFIFPPKTILTKIVKGLEKVIK